MALLGPKAGPRVKDVTYRIRTGVKPYGGRILYPEYEEANRIGGRIKGATATRWYDRDELERV